MQVIQKHACSQIQPGRPNDRYRTVERPRRRAKHCSSRRAPENEAPGTLEAPLTIAQQPVQLAQHQFRGDLVHASGEFAGSKVPPVVAGATRKKLPTQMPTEKDRRGNKDRRVPAATVPGARAVLTRPHNRCVAQTDTTAVIYRWLQRIRSLIL